MSIIITTTHKVNVLEKVGKCDVNYIYMFTLSFILVKVRYLEISIE